MASGQVPQRIKMMAVTVPACVRLAVLVGPAHERPRSIKLFGALVMQLSRLVPDLGSVAWPALTSLLVDLFCVLICLLRLVVSGWSLLHLFTQLV